MELGFNDVSTGTVFDFGSVVLSEQDIIDFALQHDPMPFHIDKEAAMKSPFKGLVASGIQLFQHFYLKEWVPRFKNSVMAGKGITEWLLHRPVYAGKISYCSVEITEHDPKPERGYGAITWHFRFTDEQGQLLQHLNLIVFHHLK
jgi:acyl dehydratase